MTDAPPACRPRPGPGGGRTARRPGPPRPRQCTRRGRRRPCRRRARRLRHRPVV